LASAQHAAGATGLGVPDGAVGKTPRGGQPLLQSVMPVVNLHATITEPAAAASARSLAMGGSTMTTSAQQSGSRRRQELGAFLFLTVVLFPVLAVLIVSGYGFAVWAWQMLFGPPGL